VTALARLGTWRIAALKIPVEETFGASHALKVVDRCRIRRLTDLISKEKRNAWLRTGWNRYCDRVSYLDHPQGVNTEAHDQSMLYQRKNMKILKPCLCLLTLVAVGTLVGCATTSAKSADISDKIRTSLDQAGFKDVSASQDRDKGVVTLGGHVAAERDKSQAESIARSIAGNQVVANQIAVIPVGVESEAKKVNSDLDKGIESNLDAALIQEDFHKSVKYTVKNHVVTLTGEVNSQTQRARAERVAAGVPNVQQVVNELQVKGQKASSSN
jgi:osmotically-inducible protein OsmY